MISQRRCSIKKDILKTFAKVKGKCLCQSLVFSCLGLQLYSRRDPTEFSKVTFFTEYLRMTGSESTLQGIKVGLVFPEISFYCGTISN